jgi:ubiquinone/menaquinone biosynthesis C-methylase UbiE
MTNAETADVLPPEPGYDLAAAWYDYWHWSEFWRRNEVPIVRPLLRSGPRGLALDAGSGTGLYRFALQAAGHDTVCIDISRRMLDVQAAKQRGDQARLVHGDIQHMPSDWHETFGSVVCARVLSHIQDYRTALCSLGGVLRKGGRMILTDVDPHHPYAHVTVKKGVVYSKIRVFKHSHSGISAGLEGAGFHVVKLQRYRLADLLWKPDHALFPQIHGAPDTDIFFVCEAVKC